MYYIVKQAQGNPAELNVFNDLHDAEANFFRLESEFDENFNEATLFEGDRAIAYSYMIDGYYSGVVRL